MKHTISLFALIFFSLQLSAQYFTREYGTTAPADRLTDGTPVISGPAGHILAGTTNIVSNTDMVLIRTDAAGATPGLPTFRNYYRLLSSTGAVLTSTPAKVIQMPAGRIFVAGTYTGTAATDKGVYTAVFNPDGTVGAIAGWKTTAAATTTITATSACRSNIAGDETVYVTGSVDLAPYNTTLGSGVFIIAVNGNNNALVWSQTYWFSALSGETAADIIASPYNSNAELVVAGNFNNSGDRGSFLMRVNRTTTFPISANTFNYTTNESVSGIALAPSPISTNEGFVLCGTTNSGSAINRMWVFRVNANCNAVINNVFIAYSNSASTISGSDIISRTNAMSNLEFYASGTAATGQLGQNDMVVVKLSATLGFVGEYTYGTVGTSESNQEIAGLTDGIGIYGNIRISSLATNGDMYVAKAYYNGVTQCNTASNTSVVTVAALTTTTTPVDDVKDLAQPGLSISSIGNVTIFSYCNAVSVAGGSNARNAAPIAEETDNSTQVFPNPVSITNPLVQLLIHSPSEQQIEIRITDMLGREVMNQQIMVAEGQSVQQIQLPHGISTGAYNITVTAGDRSENHRLLVQ
jgi:hypothetical protein